MVYHRYPVDYKGFTLPVIGERAKITKFGLAGLYNYRSPSAWNEFFHRSANGFLRFYAQVVGICGIYKTDNTVVIAKIDPGRQCVENSVKHFRRKAYKIIAV
jgi:hypothetical protein